ncbi:MAG: hypothetical protein GX581_03480 [Syntrophomonadaceae bacterium]|nr:hypothetical protein [Syntrophomonadaceae bacterium]
MTSYFAVIKRIRLFMPGLLLLVLVSANLTAAVEPARADAAETLEIVGDGVDNPVTLSLDQLNSMEQYEHIYSTINTWPTKRWYAARGVSLRDLFIQAEINSNATLIKLISSDGYDVTLTVKELIEDKRYYFPGLKDNDPADGSIPGLSEGAVEVEPILALCSAEGSDDLGAMNDRDALLLVLGQRAVTEQTNHLFLKYISKIEVLTTAPETWDSPKANIPSGTILPVGAEIELSNKNNNEDKIYYTTDGTTPTIDSPMFNWSASRWWDQRGDVKGVNKAIEVEKDTIIKMITIGPGKLDSEVVTFKFTADLTGKAVDPTKVPGGPPTGVFLDTNRIDQPVGSTFRLEATIVPFNADNQDLIWRSSDTRVATVDNRGLVTIVGPGTAIITVTTADGRYKATCLINGPEAVQSEKDIAAEKEQEQTAAEPQSKDLPGDGEPDLKAVVNDIVDLPEPDARLEYLAKIDELSADELVGIQQLEFESLQAFELTADTIPLPLKEARDRMQLYTAIILLVFLFSGAGHKYIQYMKERS